MSEPSPLLEAFRTELEALLRRYPTVTLTVAQTIQAQEVVPQVPVPVSVEQTIPKPDEFLPDTHNGDTKEA